MFCLSFTPVDIALYVPEQPKLATVLVVAPQVRLLCESENNDGERKR